MASNTKSTRPFYIHDEMYSHHPENSQFKYKTSKLFTVANEEYITPASCKTQQNP